MILKGQKRRSLQDYIAYGRAQWELEWENSPLYQKERERAEAEGRTIKIEPFGREQIVRAIPDEWKGVQLRGEHHYLRLTVSDAFIKETQRRVARWKHDIVEFGDEQWKRR